MKFLVALAVFAFLGAVLDGASAGSCDAMTNISNLPKNESFVNLEDKCSKQLITQIKREIRASYKYFQMGAYFARDQVNLPGFSELFFNAAKEERDHSAVLMNYLSMRMAVDGQVENVAKAIFSDASLHMSLEPQSFSGVKALQEAHTMELTITKAIKNIIKACDKVGGEDGDKEYHVSDFLTGDFLTEQYNSERSFGGKLATLMKMSDQHGSLAEFMFDKSL